MQPTVSPSASWCRYCEAAPPGYLVRARVGGWGLGLRSGSGSGLGSGLWLPLPLPLTGVPLHQQVKGAEPRLLGDGRVRAHGVVGRTRHAQQQARLIRNGERAQTQGQGMRARPQLRRESGRSCLPMLTLPTHSSLSSHCRSNPRRPSKFRQLKPPPQPPLSMAHSSISVHIGAAPTLSVQSAR